MADWLMAFAAVGAAGACATLILAAAAELQGQPRGANGFLLSNVGFNVIGAVCYLGARALGACA